MSRETSMRLIAERCLEHVTEHGGIEHDATHPPTDWLKFIRRQLHKAAEAEQYQDLAEYRQRLINVAALALDALTVEDFHEENYQP